MRRALLSCEATRALAAADIWRDLPLCCMWSGGRTYHPPDGGRKEAVSMGGRRKDETGTEGRMVKWHSEQTRDIRK